MTLTDDPVSGRLFVSDMRGILYVISPDGQRVGRFLDIRDAAWGVAVQAGGRERGLQSFALHPQFGQAGTPGFGKFYTFLDISDQAPAPDFVTPNENTSHDTVLLEWSAATPGSARYDGAAPRELLRFRQPFANHNGGAMAFNSTARPDSPDFGLLYVSVADGGSGGDPMALAQNLGSAFGKILRIDPLGRSSGNGKYGIPAGNPFRTRTGALAEIFAYGIRNVQRLGWDSRTGAMFLSDIGQNIIEEVSPVTAGANLGWSLWEGSYRFVSTRAVRTDSLRSDPGVTYPIVEWGQLDPILLANTSSASVGVVVYRGTEVPQLNGRLIFGDMPSGEMFHVSADQLPNGGQDPIRRVLFRTAPGEEPRTFLEIIQATNTARGREPATRADMRFDMTSGGQVFVLNKADGVIRVIAP
jgi:hypothetical protein